MLNKKVQPRFVVCTNTSPVNAVYKVGKVQAHSVQGLNFASYVAVPQFKQGTQFAGFYLCFKTSVVPDNPVITAAVSQGFKLKTSGNAALNQHLPAQMNHKLVTVPSVGGNLYKTGKFFHQQIPPVHQIVRIVPHCL